MPDRLRLSVSDLGRIGIFGDLPWDLAAASHHLFAYVEPDGPDAASMLVSEIDGSRSFTATFCSDFVGRPVIEAALEKKAFVRFSVPFSALKLAAFASETLGKATGKAVMLTRDKVNELTAPHWVCDSTATRRDLHWTPKVKWPEGTRLSVEWYRANGWL